MNRTNFEHAAIAVFLQLLLAAITGSLVLGAVFAVGVFIGREHAQREYRLGDPSKLKGYEALDFWRWTLDEQLDLLFPVVAVALVGWVGSTKWL